MIKKILKGILPIGLIIFFIARACAQYLSMTDFIRGFLEGISLVFIVVGLIYVAWCYVKKKNTCIK